MIICGKCKAKHETVAQVKACYNVAPAFTAELDLKTPEFVAAIQAKEAAEDAVAYASKHAIVETKTITPVTEPGIYRFEDTIVRVKVSKENHLYAQSLKTVRNMVRGTTKVQFMYESGLIFKISAADKMTLDAANEFSLKIGNCCCCGKILTNEKSVNLGIGPVCRKKYF